MFGKFLILVCALALAVGLAARGSSGAGPKRTYVVRPGDTLWSVAERTYSGDPRQGVWSCSSEPSRLGNDRPGREARRALVGAQATAGARSEGVDLLAAEGRCSGSQGNPIRTFHSSRPPTGAWPSHGACWVAETFASSQTPCGPITMSVRSKRMSGKAVRSSV